MITLADLPAPPAGRTGWPWTEAPRIEARTDGHSFTVVTPSYNQGGYLEETIRSVLLQGYPKLEYLVLDGGSTDESVAIIERYAPWITYWRSERDAGQADAIAEGLSRATGDVFNWINSDDVLQPGALAIIDPLMDEADVVAGVCVNFAPDGTEERFECAHIIASEMMSARSRTVFHQPAVWLRRANVLAAGGLERSLHYVFDWEMLVRVLNREPRVAYSSAVLARFRVHDESKTVKAIASFEFERGRAARRLADTLTDRKLRTMAAALARRQRWWRVLARLQRRYGRSPRAAAIILRSAWREPSIRLSRPTFGSMRRALWPKQ